MSKVVDLGTILRPPRLDRGSVADQADAWLAYLYSGLASDVDRQQFSRWLRESPRHAAAYASAERAWRDLGDVAAGADGGPTSAAATAPPAAKDQAAVAVSTSPSRAQRRLRVLAALAATLVVALLGWAVFHDPASVRYDSRVGEIREVVLADGSRVTLSGASSIVARMKEEGGRYVELASGRAYFDVKADRQRPFFVKAAATEIRVVGTAFDVNKSPQGVQVAVTHGLVEVRDTATGVAENVSSQMPPPPRRIQAGQKLVAKLDGAVPEEPQAFDPESELGWKSGHLRYVNTRLDAVVAEVNRYRDRKIVLADPDLGSLRITASFQADQTEQLLSGLAASYRVDIHRAGNEVRVARQ